MSSLAPQGGIAISGRLQYLDAIRGIAITLVLVVHLARPAATSALSAIYPGELPPVLAGGYIGVDIFFVLSGYIISRLLLQRRTRYVNFLRKRCSRLLPAYVTSLLVGSLLAVSLGSLTVEEVSRSALISATMITPMWIASTGQYTPPFTVTWSLAVEWYFYLFWPLLLLRFKIARQAPFLLAMAIILYVAAAIAWSHEAFYYSPVSRFSELLVGAWLATKGPLKATNKPLTISAGCALMLLFWTACGPVEFSDLYKYVGFPVAVIIAVLLIRNGEIVEDSFGCQRWFQALSVLGLSSYSIYLWHNIPITAMATDHVGGSRILTYLLSVGLAILFSVLSYKLVETQKARILINATLKLGKRPST